MNSGTFLCIYLTLHEIDRKEVTHGFGGKAYEVH